MAQSPFKPNVIHFLRNLTGSVLMILILQGAASGQGFLKVQGTKIINSATQQEVYLKGIGLGGWLLQEGYMLHTSSFAPAQWQIKERIKDLIGETNTETFYETYRQNYVTRADIDSIKKWGFNSIRLPFHYNLFAVNSNPPVFLEKGFQIIDSLLSWCEANQLYLILDMHAAPGGQSNENISDYNPAFPSLWESEANKDLTVKIWRKIAERYKDKQWIGGYDLLNEPKWDLGAGNVPLRNLYIRLTDTIRAVDTNHIVYIEGNWFATDFSGLAPAWDAQMVYSFHKYWNNNDQGSIQYLVDLRNNTQRPLWLGETGENSNHWLTTFAELVKNNNIGWASWPHKKIQSVAGPLSATLSPQYRTLLNYWSGTGTRPSADYAFNALMTQAELLKLENCTYNKDYIRALLVQPFSQATVPYADNVIPGTIYAVNYDMGRNGVAYNDNDFQNVGGNSYNSGFEYRNDGVDIEKCSDLGSNGYNVGWTQNNEWLAYTVSVAQSGIYNISYSVASPNGGGSIIAMLGSQVLGQIVSVPATGGWQNWVTRTVQGVSLQAGTHRLLLKFYTGDFNISYIDFTLISTGTEEEISAPAEFGLSQNYPNPFNPATTIEYSIAERSHVRLSVYNSLSQEVAVLTDEITEPGRHSAKFSGEKFPSGVYFLKLSSGRNSVTRKMILMK